MHTLAGEIAVAVIVACYFTFATQLVLQVRWHSRLRQGSRSLLSLVAVFVLCALTGYLSDYMVYDRAQLHAPGVTPFVYLRDGMHVGLAIASVSLVVTNAGGAVARLLSE